MSKYLKEKFDLLSELCIEPTPEQVEKMSNAKTEIALDNIVRSIINIDPTIYWLLHKKVAAAAFFFFVINKQV